jgi:hypothetical protein
MSAMRRPETRHQSGEPRSGPGADGEDLPHEWWARFEEDFHAFASDGWRVGLEAERRP